MKLSQPSLALGPCPAALLGSGAAFPTDAWTTPALLLHLAPELPGPRREALLGHLATELGVQSRAHLAPGADPLALAVEAAQRALADACAQDGAGGDAAGDAAGDAGPDPIRAVLVATSTPSRWTTAESARLAQALGLAVAFVDLRSGCTGGLWALVEGARLARDIAGRVLVVGVDSFSRAFPAGERLLPFAMGDGAAALVLGPTRTEVLAKASRGVRIGPGSEAAGEVLAKASRGVRIGPRSEAAGEVGLVRAVFGGEPALVDLATVTTPMPPAAGHAPYVLSGDPEPFAVAAEAALAASIAALAPPPGCLLVPHIGRLATARRLADQTSLALFVDGFVAHGNVGAASLLLALHLLRIAPHRPNIVALVSAGGGLSFGGALWRLEP